MKEVATEQGPSETQNPVAYVDSDLLSAYVQKNVNNFLGESSESITSLHKALVDPNGLEAIKKFISDPQIHSLFVQKLCAKGANIEADKDIHQQLLMLNFGEGSPYESLHSIVSNAMCPFFKSYIKEFGMTDRDGDKLAPSVEKKMAELEVGLLHLQQNIEIPDVSLTYNSYVVQVIKKKAEEGTKAKVSDFEDRLEDSQFLNNLQSGVNKWIKDIRKVTKLERDPASGTALQEIMFWLNMERALLRAQEKRQSLEVTLTLEILKQAKRFHAIVSFDADTGLAAALSTVNDYMPLIKDFPLNDLLSATELEKIKSAVIAIFTHLRKLRNTKYPVSRALVLINAVSRDLMNQLLKVLSTRRLMHMSYEEFDKVMNSCSDIFVTWDEDYDRQQILMRDILKKKRDESMNRVLYRVKWAHKSLQQRLDHMKKFRHQHDQLRQVIVRVLRPARSATKELPDEEANDQDKIQNENGDSPGSKRVINIFEDADSKAIEEINQAYEIVKEIECLDVSKEGQEAWDAAIKRYEERIDRVETSITACLRDLLGKAKNAKEMFRYFSRFNALFVRPHIRGAIREYQTQLINRVKDDIEALHEKFKRGYTHSSDFHMAKTLDVPPVAGSIIWVRQIENQLKLLLKRVEDILGKGWEQHRDGQSLKEDGDSFKAKLDPTEVFENWCRSVQEQQVNMSSHIFSIEPTRTRVATKDGETQTVTVMKLKVNFHKHLITLYKEVRHMKTQGFRVPLALVNRAHQTNQIYPFGMALLQGVRTYENSCAKIDENKRQNLGLLCGGMRRDVQNLISEGITLGWDSYRLGVFVQRFSDQVVQFQDKVDELLHATREIDVHIKSLDTCAYSKQTFMDILSKIQKAVDDLNLHKYSNLAQWVKNLDREIEARLVNRLDAALLEWANVLRGNASDVLEAGDDECDLYDDENDNEKRGKTKGCRKIKPIAHELRITNQQIHLHPPIQSARKEILLDFTAWQNVVLLLPRLQHSRYEVGFETENESQKVYKNILSKLFNQGGSLYEALKIVNKTIENAEKYVTAWTSYQSLWDIQSDQVYNRLGNNLEDWMNVLDEIKSMRKLFDVSESQKEFGPIVINFGKVQSKVSLKYDNWHKDILGKFGANLATEMGEFFTRISEARKHLEQQSIDVGSTGDSINLITYTQELRRKINTWEKQVGLFRVGQNILYRDRFPFPEKWLDCDNVTGEWSAFLDILRRREASISNQMSTLQVQIVSEDKTVENKTNDLLTEWDKLKPVQGNTKPEDAVKTLAILEGKFKRIREDRDNIQRAKEALFLTENGVLPPSEDKVKVANEELTDLKNVWNEISGVWEKIEQLKETPWQTMQPRKLRASIDEMVAQLKEMPARFRHYASYEHVKKILQSYGKVNVIIIELKSEALKERHWKSLMRKLNVNWIMAELTLGNVWDVDLLKNEAVIREILLVAQGEKALEEFLRQVTEIWKSYELELIAYQNKCRLIKGWDDLFSKVKEHINSVTAMKFSPYFKQFEEEALSWEDRLNRINALFDVWIDVQRRWVYLDGIFAGSADIKTLLPQESQRFNSVSTEFLSLMKKVGKSPLVMDILNISNVQRQLERLGDLLTKIQRSLGEYLEKQRSSFPRFYFVGDEDLLEIIGNSKTVGRLQKHFKKMFAGVDNIRLNQDSTEIQGIASKEGEVVQFVNPISLKDNPIINDWLLLLEKQMRVSLATYLGQAVQDLQKMKTVQDLKNNGFLDWVDKYQAQLIVLASQIVWSESVETALNQMGGKGNPADENSPLNNCLKAVNTMLNVLADSVLYEQPVVRRRKLEQLIIEHVHQRDVIRALIKNGVNSSKSFDWISHMRFYFDAKQTDPLNQVSIQMANAKFCYGFEYLGIIDRLVQTPLTDRCFLTMTQALEGRLGGSPFGPAGTGKTESVKALGTQLGRFVLVFNCDETFDFHAMGRIFVGLCQVGAWGCFDEFNRLEERMLSAVSQQIQGIQESLRELGSSSLKGSGKDVKVELLQRQVSINPDMAIFITMNPGYAGRSNLPDNLKKLFRSLAMTQPDRQLIAQVTLYSQGFRSAELLASKVVPFFKLCHEQLSPQSHYDFGLRALKSVLASAGNLKRNRIRLLKDEKNDASDETGIAEKLPEQEILIQSLMETLVPKLIAEDIPLMNSLISDVFPNVEYDAVAMNNLKDHIKQVCKEMFLVYGDKDSVEDSQWATSKNGVPCMGSLWVEKVLQLYQISNLHHGLMMVGPSGSGKSTAWRVLLKALERWQGVEGVAHVIDPKSISKDSLYGYLDPNTREWTDGLFTHILRKIIDSIRGEATKRQWIIFDGDVDPEWVENLNSVLDENKLLTLPNGERLAIPPNVRIMFEVQDLKCATMATVTRCGMIWFSEDVVSSEMILENFILSTQNVPIDEGEEDIQFSATMNTKSGTLPGVDAMSPTEGNAPGLPTPVSPAVQVQRDVGYVLQPHFQEGGLITRCLDFAKDLEHIMDFTKLRALTSMFSIIKQMIRNIIAYNQTHVDFPMTQEQIESYVSKSLISAIVWSMAGDGRHKVRQDMCDFITKITTVPLPPQGQCIIDYEVNMNGEWQPWTNKVPQIDVDTHKIDTMDVVVPTLDTVRHEALLYTWLAEHRPMLLCGPPGSGKTMTLFSALRCLPDMEVIGLNFSSATTPELMMKTFDQYCEYRKTPNGLVLAPQQLNKWLVFFCDEINLPDEDKYGTQRVISFLRQIVENGGFYQTTGEMQWVHFERIQFVGACNPPTDPGRKPLSHRFLRHVPLVYVDYPGETSLKQIYGTFNRAMLRPIPTLRSQADALTAAMVEFYLMSQQRFTVDMQPHYIYSPREMTRWVRGIHEALKPLDSLPTEGLVRIWAHEALRLFQDRLVEDEERDWTDKNVNEVAMKYFPSIDQCAALQRPILYSNWLSKEYSPVDQEELREYVKARLKVFYEEELDVQLVLFNQVLDHVLRIDRVFRQPQGHLLLIGVSGAGKTTLSRFVSWINGLSVFQVKVHNGYTAENFDDDLRIVLRRAGCKNEKITFIMDESNIMDSSFLERMNTLLANGEVPGLFEGDEFTTLMTQCKEGATKEGLMIDSNEELYKWFTNNICRNLHVVFTMNPSVNGLKDCASTSPALFNRCVLNWFGDWSTQAYYQVGKEFSDKLDLERLDYKLPDFVPVAAEGLLPENPTHRDMVVNAFVFVHQTLHDANEKLKKRTGRTMAITPRHYLDFINHYVKLIGEKRSNLEEEQLHLNIGLQKIKETVEQVEIMQKSLTTKRQELEAMNEAANAKLQQMLHEQQEVEKENKLSQQLQEELAEQEKFINVKRSEVMEELSQVEPAVNDAKQAVEGINRKDLQILRTMKQPPAAVKMALESICLLLGERAADWRGVLSILAKDNFVPNIINFDTTKVNDDIREVMKRKYLNNPDYNFEKVNRASTACGPMVKWAIAQIGYADILKKVEPLRNELKELEDAACTNKDRAKQVEIKIRELEISSAKFKEEYAVLVSQVNEIKADLASVEGKVSRSVALIQSLSDERGRWENGSDTFRHQMNTIIGDCLLSSAFMAYAGYFDQTLRASLFSTWHNHLESAGIKFRSDLARVEYLSVPEDRLRWKSNALPDDDLCTENAIILGRYNRYPLMIDPSGQATEFLLNEYRDKKIAKTSFLDSAFRKTLEASLRFGTPLLVQDVEAYDPILNPVLNYEVRKTGGRTLITLGDQDIDLSPTFKIFLSTRDPSVEFPPHLCSRVTFVNFTVTRSSLVSQCLNAALKAERPDVDKKRSDLLKVQGEFQLKLRKLEKDLLTSLNESKGNLLDDDTIIARLETLKKEAADVMAKVEETDKIMSEVETVSQQYHPLAFACMSIFFTLEAMNQIHFLYQYSLQFILDIYDFVLSDNENLKEIRDPNRRLLIIMKDLFQICYNRASRGMLHNDQITFAVLLARIYLRGGAGFGPQAGQNAQQLEPELLCFLKGVDTSQLAAKGVVSDKSLLSPEQMAGIKNLQSVLPSFKNIESHMKQEGGEFSSWISSVAPESSVPTLWDTPSSLQTGPLSKIASSVYELLAVQTFRPDRILASVHRFTNAVLGESFKDFSRGHLDLTKIVEGEIKSNMPLILCSAQGFDPSGRVEDMAQDLKKQLTSIAIGSSEGFAHADTAITSAAKQGRWVMLKNVHLAANWLVQLEKKLHSVQLHPQFRLFLTSELGTKIPVNLIRSGRVIVFEPPPGIKASLSRTLLSVPTARMCKAPTERARLYFLLAWFNAVVQERLRYVPLGWSKKYEFNESDLRCAFDTIDVWVDNAAMGRTNLPPEKVPWAALRTLFAECIYGSKIDNEFDQRLMASFLGNLFSEASFDHDFPLVKNVNGVEGSNISIPDGSSRDEFVQWVSKLADTQTPSWLGLPNNAEKVLLTHLGRKMIGDLLKMQQSLEDDDAGAAMRQDGPTNKRKASLVTDTRPAWMIELQKTSLEWLKLLPEKIKPLKRTAENIKDPMYRCFEREINSGLTLLNIIRKDLNEVIEVCKAERKPTNHHRQLMSDLAKSLIPAGWRKYVVPSNLTILQWIRDFALRVEQLVKFSEMASTDGPESLKTAKIWLGGLFMPEAYITATRQSVAQTNSWALEELYLDSQLYLPTDTKALKMECATEPNTFLLQGFRLMGGQVVDKDSIELSSNIFSEMPVTLIRWIRVPKEEQEAKFSEGEMDVRLPVYMNGARATILFTLKFATKQPGKEFYKRGVAILASALE